MKALLGALDAENKRPTQSGLAKCLRKTSVCLMMWAYWTFCKKYWIIIQNYLQNDFKKSYLSFQVEKEQVLIKEGSRFFIYPFTRLKIAFRFFFLFFFSLDGNIENECRPNVHNCPGAFYNEQKAILFLNFLYVSICYKFSQF